MPLKHACHKVYEIKYHLIFIIKYRKDLFLEERYVSCLKDIMKDIEKRYFLIPETMGFEEDHVHMLMQAAPRYAPSRVFQIVKSIAARELFQRFPELKEELWGGEFWSDGGFVRTVGEGTNAELIRNYIKKQGRNDEQLKLVEFTEA